MKERDELIFAERVLEQLKDGGDVTTLTPTKVAPVATAEPDSIEEALWKLSNPSNSRRRAGAAAPTVADFEKPRSQRPV